MNLRPCKKCGSENSFKTVTNRHRVKCGNCGFVTPQFKSEEFAISSWNDRELSDQIQDLLNEIIVAAHPDGNTRPHPSVWWRIVILARNIKDSK